eukprot:SAG25_NODE_4_length_30349_cov_110.018280_8_plen_85_part_00
MVLVRRGLCGGIRARRRVAQACDVRCVPPGAPPEALKLVAVSRGTNINYRPTDHVRMHMIKRGLVYPGACGAHSYFCIGVQCRG